MDADPADELHPPEAVPELPDERAMGMMSVSPQRRAELASRAREWIRDLAAAVPDSAACRR